MESPVKDSNIFSALTEEQEHAMKTITQKREMFFYVLIYFSVPAILLLSTLNQRLTGISNFRKSNYFSSHDFWHIVHRTRC